MITRAPFRRLAAALALAAAGSLAGASADAAPAYGAYPAKPAFSHRVMPVFTGKYRKYASFRTAITGGFHSEERFAGHYVLFGIGCGAGCRSFTLGDLKTGAIYGFPLGGEANMYLTLDFKPDSRLVHARWEDVGGGDHGGDLCVHQDFVWGGTAFKSVGETRRVQGACAL